MDPEQQPLLNSSASTCVQRRRALTREEVIRAQSAGGWSRGRCALVVMFWSAMAAMLTGVACVLLSAQPCGSQMPSVPPVHLSFTPLAQSYK